VRPDRVAVFAPGSVSNLGAGFDCLGAAVAGIGDRVVAERGTHRGVVVSGVSDARIPSDPARNTAALAAAAALRLAGSEAGVRLRVEKGLPLAGGLGGSAASAVAGARAADALLGLGLEPEALLVAALEAEAVVAGRHADNVAPSLLGGAVLVVGLEPPRLGRVRVHADLALALATPDYAVATAAARSVLPASVSRGDAVGQAARLGALLLGLERGDAALLREAMRDAIAEPARASLYPGHPAARAAGIAAGALGVAVSGAGPTLVALAWRDDAAAVARALATGFARSGIGAEARAAGIDPEGARVVA
jgi:homoserine kinase